MKKVFFIGQAMPKPPYPDRPFGRTKLYQWFQDAGISDEVVENQFYFSALVAYFPGSVKGKGHLVPTPAQIAEERPRLVKEILELKPDVFVAVGKLATEELLNVTGIKLDDYIGKSFEANPFDLLESARPLIPLAHPSGASTWFYKKTNRQLLDLGLKLLHEELKNE